MYMNLAGEWNISLEADQGRQSGKITLPGTLQAAGYGNPVTRDTPWVSTLHDAFWYEQEEYKFAQEDGVNVPFLAQPPRHFLGQAVYERKFSLREECPQEWYFHAELARWRSQVWVDGEYKGEDCTLCGPHDIFLGRIGAGEHTLRVLLDNSMIYPYRPDGHGVSDALGASWNGMVGEIALFTEDERQKRKADRIRYAEENPRTTQVRQGRFVIDGEPVYFRATHFGGEFPLTGYPATEKDWWRRMMSVIKEWGLNGIRFHSYCPPEAAFAVADEMNVYLLVECGMWNRFEEGPAGEEMFEVLRRETRRILENFGHHPSFVFFSPSNEPGGKWFLPLRRWVSETREYDEALGYGGRRIYTAQSGWAYDVPPAEITGTDFLYFHRSGPTMETAVRSERGWWGKDFGQALEGAALPAVCHELGQICAYPDYNIIRKFKGYMRPGNYKVFRENARANGLLPYVDSFVACSGENQLRLYKEELEANYRTPQLQGFELLDLHDYLGQGTALVGILDAFWESKGYGDPAVFRNCCQDTVILVRMDSYVFRNTDRIQVPVEVCHYGRNEIKDGRIRWSLNAGDKVFLQGELPGTRIEKGGNTRIGNIELDFRGIRKNREMTLRLKLESESVTAENSWELCVFTKEEFSDPAEAETETAGQAAFAEKAKVLYTRDWEQARAALEAGGRVVYAPWLSDLGYNSPALSGRSVNWNGQMGPSWCRTLGIVVDREHPIFRHFPTKRSGGWQWDDILKNARGFCMEKLGQIEPVVQPIDDWNRSLPQSLIFEANVLKGRLLLVSAGLDVDFEESPARWTLKQALLQYAASGEFCPEKETDPQDIEAELMPVLRMDALTENVTYNRGCTVVDGDALVEANPGTSARIRREDFPVEITVMLKKPVTAQGVVYVPEQCDRNHAGFAEKYCLEVGERDKETVRWEKAAEGKFLNTCRAQQILFDREIRGDVLRLTVFSAYGCRDKYVWKQDFSGWHQEFQPLSAFLQIAGLHVLCREEGPHCDDYSAKNDRRSRTEEIEF